MKRISVKKAATDETPRDLEIEPGTTAYDVLRGLNLDPNRNALNLPEGKILRGNDPVYTEVKDGGSLLITEQATVGAAHAAH